MSVNNSSSKHPDLNCENPTEGKSRDSGPSHSISDMRSIFDEVERSAGYDTVVDPSQ